MRPDASTLVDEIQAAFAATPYPGDGLVHGGEYGDEIGRDFRGRAWRDLTPDVLRHHSWACSLLFMTPEAFGYYLPAFLIASLRDGEVLDHTTFVLMPPAPTDARMTDLFRRRVAGLTTTQREAIAGFWMHLAGRTDDVALLSAMDALAYRAPESL
jgi:hypothetical protein